MKFKTIKESQIEISQLMLPSNSNFSGKIHGGFILSLMDQVAFACASKHSGYYCVTASVNNVDFINPIEVGELVHIKASINYTGKTSMVVGLRVEAENIQTGELKHCNSSYFTMVAKNDKGENVPVPGLILDTVNAIRHFAMSVHAQKQGRTIVNDFKATEFKVSEHLDILANHNAKIEL